VQPATTAEIQREGEKRKKNLINKCPILKAYNYQNKDHSILKVKCMELYGVSKNGVTDRDEIQGGFRKKQYLLVGGLGDGAAVPAKLQLSEV